MSIERFTLLFPLWTLLGAGLSMFVPGLFIWFSGPWIEYGLGLIMLGMGLGLRPADFMFVFKRPRPAVLGVFAQFLVMPGLAALIAMALRLDPALAVGLILVGCCPGGTASNVVALIARADVALSVVMTTFSTLAAVILTPLLTSWLAGRYVPVDGWSLFASVLKVVLFPVSLGVLIKLVTPRFARRVEPILPPIAVLAIVLIVASIVGSQRASLSSQGPLLLLAVVLLHSGGFVFGYWLTAFAGEPLMVRRTVSIEVGMQNSGLAVVLARTAGFISPITALPGALSAVINCLSGSLLAAFWRGRAEQMLSPSEKSEAKTQA